MISKLAHTGRHCFVDDGGEPCWEEELGEATGVLAEKDRFWLTGLNGLASLDLDAVAARIGRHGVDSIWLRSAGLRGFVRSAWYFSLLT